MKLKNLLVLAVVFIAFIGKSQELDKKTKKIVNWYNGAKYGMSTDKAYKKLLKDRKAETVIVAVLDSGTDIEHEDLKDIIWTNKDEIPGNGIDDDKNGYIDDVHGWNFLGNAKGENINDVQLEMTRIYAKLDKKFAGKEASDISPADKADFKLYQEVKTKVETKYKEAEGQYNQYSQMAQTFEGADKNLTKHFGTSDYKLKDLKKLEGTDLEKDAKMITQLMGYGATVADIKNGAEHFESAMKYHYNKDLDARKIVGDNPEDFNDKFYGNNDAEGPDALHGSHCSGIIAAVRGNGLGGDGVADNVLIMPIRAVPNGDERDKDIALGIRYAVDNGAQVINMSFGKAYSPQADEVIKAIKYAEEKGVLCVHAAGNSGLLTDDKINSNFPSPQYPGMSTRFTNWIEVGASTRYKKAKKGKNPAKNHNGLAASFSNYGPKTVDVFAPGLEIYSTVPQSEYISIQGTSMAAPMVAGLAALLKGYFPELTMIQVKEIIFKSVKDVSDHVTPIPGGTTETTFSELCATGGIVNTYNAVKMAIEMTSK